MTTDCRRVYRLRLVRSGQPGDAEEDAMVMPLAGRVLAAVVGGLLVLVAVYSVTATLIVSRRVNSRLTRWVDQMVGWAYQQVARRFADPHRPSDSGYPGGGGAAGPADGVAAGGVRRVRPAVVAVRQPRCGVRLRRCRLLAVHPRLRGARRGGAGGDRFPRGGDRAGDLDPADRLPADPVRGVQPPRDSGGPAEQAGRDPVVGPEMLARTYYALGSGVSTLDTMPDLYERWENSAAASPRAIPPTRC